MEVLVPIITLVVGALLGFFGEKLRRKHSLVDRRLEAAHEALSVVARLAARLLDAPESAYPFYDDNAGVMGAGVEAASALGAVALCDRIREAQGLMNSLKGAVEADKRDLSLIRKLEGELDIKFAEAFKEYEAVRSKLFKLL